MPVQMSHHTLREKKKADAAKANSAAEQDTDTVNDDNDADPGYLDNKGQYDEFDSMYGEENTDSDTEDDNNDADSDDFSLGTEDNEIDPEKELAKSKGHMDYDAWIKAGREPDEWVSPKIFNEIGELRAGNAKAHKRLKEQSETITELVKFQTNQIESSHQETLEALEEQKKEAIKIGDGDTVIEVERKLRKLEENKQAAPKYTPSTEEELDTTPKNAAEKYYKEKWLPKNMWFANPGPAQKAGQAYATAYVKEYPDATAEQMFAYVDMQMEKHYPEVVGGYKNPNSGRKTNRTAGVQGRGRNKPAGGKSYDLKSLSKSQQNMFHQINKHSKVKMTVKAYIDGLKSSQN